MEHDDFDIDYVPHTDGWFSGSKGKRVSEKPSTTVPPKKENIVKGARDAVRAVNGVLRKADDLAENFIETSHIANEALRDMREHINDWDASYNRSKINDANEVDGMLGLLDKDRKVVIAISALFERHFDERVTDFERNPNVGDFAADYRKSVGEDYKKLIDAMKSFKTTINNIQSKMIGIVNDVKARRLEQANKKQGDVSHALDWAWNALNPANLLNYVVSGKQLQMQSICNALPRGKEYGTAASGYTNFDQRRPRRLIQKCACCNKFILE